MANTKSAKKKINVIRVKTNRNKRVKRHLKNAFKSFDLAVVNGSNDDAAESLAKAEKKLMQAAAKGTIHKNTASRKVSKLNKRYNKAEKAQQEEE